MDTVAPVLSRVGLTNKIFRVGPKPTAVTAVAKRGTKFRYTLSEAASVTITIQRARPGRRTAGRCVKRTPALRRAKKCTRYTKTGALRRASAEGANKVPFSGRIGRKALRPGRYRALFVATDAAGNKTPKPVARSFTVIRP